MPAHFKRAGPPEHQKSKFLFDTSQNTVDAWFITSRVQQKKSRHQRPSFFCYSWGTNQKSTINGKERKNYWCIVFRALEASTRRSFGGVMCYSHGKITMRTSRYSTRLKPRAAPHRFFAAGAEQKGRNVSKYKKPMHHQKSLQECPRHRGASASTTSPVRALRKGPFFGVRRRPKGKMSIQYPLEIIMIDISWRPLVLELHAETLKMTPNS